MADPPASVRLAAYGEGLVSVDEFRALVARLSYKPGWEVVALDGVEENVVTLRVAFTVPDASGKVDQPLPLRIKYPIPAGVLWHLDERQALRLVFEKVLEMEKHEAREWFKIDGVPVDYPHGPTGELLP